MVADKLVGAFVGSTLDELDPTRARRDESAATKEVTNANDEDEDLTEAHQQKTGGEAPCLIHGASASEEGGEDTNDEQIGLIFYSSFY